MVKETPYSFENWFQPSDAPLEELTRLGFDGIVDCFTAAGTKVLFLAQDDDYQGSWSAFVTDGHRVGLVDGSFGSCDGCDWLSSCTSTAEFAEFATEHLQSIRTFLSWDVVRGYLKETVADRRWNFAGTVKALMEFAELDLHLGAADIFTTLVADGVPVATAAGAATQLAA